MRLRMPRGVPVLMLALTLVLVNGSAQATPTLPVAESGLATTGDWPMYGHDAARTNYNPAETTISAANLGQLVQRWQANIGSGPEPPSGAPSIANGRVYVGSSVAAGNNFFAFDAVTGASAWSANIGHQSVGCFNVGIGATAAIMGNVVVAGGGDAAYYAFNAATGSQLWRNPMNVGSSGFPWASPLVTSNRVYLGMASRCDNPSVRGEVRELELSSGAPIHSQYFVNQGQAGGGIWNSPALSPDGGTLVVATGEDYNGADGPYTRAIVAMNPDSLAITGANKQGPTGQDADYGTTPVVFHDSQGRTLVGANHKDGNFYALQLNNVNAGPVWSIPTNGQVGLMPAYDPSYGNGGTLFIASGGAQLGAYDPANGHPRWPAVTVDTYGNIAVANGLIFANEGSNGLKILDETNGNVLRTIMPPHAGGAFSGVAVANGFIYWLSGGYLNAWSLPGFVPPTATPSGCGITFSDVSPTDYYYEPVRYLYCAGILSGYSDNTFRPGAGTTRGQMVKIIANAYHIPAYTPAQPTFSDVPAAHPFYAPIEAAAHAGIISGYSDGTFHPGAGVTRGQLAKIVVNAAGWPLQTPAQATFTDVPPGSPFFSAIETAVCHGIISGYADGSFRPGAGATRGQISKIVYGALTGSSGCTAPAPAAGTTTGAAPVVFSTARLQHLCIIEH